MRKLIPISALASLLLLSLSLQAQMHGGSGSRGGFGGSRSSSSNSRGFSSAPGSSSGFRAAPAFRGSGFRGGGFASGPVVRTGRSMGFRNFGHSSGFVSFGRPFSSGGFRRFGRGPVFFNDCFGFFPCRSSFFGGGLFIGAPFYGGFYPGYPGFYPDYYAPPPPAGYYDGSNNVALESEVRSLAEQVQDMREDQQEDRRDAQRDNRQSPSQNAQPGRSMSAAIPASAVTFIFRDGRRMTAQNYAISGQSLWIFSENSAKRYSLSDIDRDATQKTNEANGVDLRLPEPAR